VASLEILTSAGQLGLASEFRFDYWRTDIEHRYFLVKRGRRAFDQNWVIIDGEVSGMPSFWDGADWRTDLLGPDAYRWELEPALVVTKELAFEENQRMIAVMESRFGGYRGGKHDLAARKEKA